MISYSILHIDGQNNCDMIEREVISVNVTVPDEKWVADLLPDRDADAHKGDCGRICIISGSLCFTGAPELASLGALRCGAGLVYLCVPACIHGIEAAKLMEPVVVPLPDDGRALVPKALEEIAPWLKRSDVVLMGPGLSATPGTRDVVLGVLESFPGTVILDADGINVLQAHKDVVRDRTGHTILTPHPGEFTRLGGSLQMGREAAAVEMARDLGAIVVLKGHNTITTDGDKLFVNPTGNPGMAVGGCGDLLAGMIAGLAGQGIAPLDAAVAGVWLHGKAGDLCADEIGTYGMLPSDMVCVLPRLLK